MHQLVLDQRCGEYELPNGDALIACGNRETATELRPETAALLQVDAAAQDAAIHASDDLPEQIAIKERGGGDFRPGFAWLSGQGAAPGLLPVSDRHEMRPLPGGRARVIWRN